MLRPEIGVAKDGSLVSVTMPRWSRPQGRTWGDHPYGGVVGEEREFDGIRIPTTMCVGYDARDGRGSSKDSYRATITSAVFF